MGTFWPDLTRGCDQILLWTNADSFWVVLNTLCSTNTSAYEFVGPFGVPPSSSWGVSVVSDVDLDGADDVLSAYTDSPNDPSVFVIPSLGGSSRSFAPMVASQVVSDEPTAPYDAVTRIEVAFTSPSSPPVLFLVVSRSWAPTSGIVLGSFLIWLPHSPSQTMVWDAPTSPSVAEKPTNLPGANNRVDPFSVFDVDGDGIHEVIYSPCNPPCPLSLLVWNDLQSKYVSSTIGGTAPNSLIRNACSLNGDAIVDLAYADDSGLRVYITPPGLTLKSPGINVGSAIIIAPSPTSGHLTSVRLTNDPLDDLVVRNGLNVNMWINTPFASSFAGPTQVSSSASHIQAGTLIPSLDAQSLVVYSSLTKTASLLVGSGTSDANSLSPFSSVSITSDRSCVSPSLLQVIRDPDAIFPGILAVCTNAVVYAPGSSDGPLSLDPTSTVLNAHALEAPFLFDINSDTRPDLFYFTTYTIPGPFPPQPRLAVSLNLGQELGQGAWAPEVAFPANPTAYYFSFGPTIRRLVVGTFVEGDGYAAHALAIFCDDPAYDPCLLLTFALSADLQVIDFPPSAEPAPAPCDSAACDMFAIDLLDPSSSKRSSTLILTLSQQVGPLLALNFSSVAQGEYSVTNLCPSSSCTGPVTLIETARGSSTLWFRMTSGPDLALVYLPTSDLQSVPIVVRPDFGHAADELTLSPMDHSFALDPSPSLFQSLLVTRLDGMGMGVVDPESGVFHTVASSSLDVAFVAASNNAADLDFNGFPDLVFVNGDTSTFEYFPDRPMTYSPPIDAVQTPFPATLAEIADRLSRVSPCISATVRLGPGQVFSGCALVDHVAVATSASWTIEGDPESPAVIDCLPSGGGVLFSVGSGSSLTLRHVVVRHPSFGSGPDATTAFRVAGSDATLVFENVVIEHASTESMSSLRFLAGVGSAVFVGEQGTFHATSSSFVNCTAAMGGAVAVAGDGADVVIESSAFVGNTAVGEQSQDGRGGGAMVVSGQGASVVFDSVRLSHNNALADGGAVLVQGTRSTHVLFSNSTLSFNSASFGGAVHLMAGDESQVLFAKGTVIESNVGGFGGCLSASRLKSVLPASYAISTSFLPQHVEALDGNLMLPTVAHMLVSDPSVVIRRCSAVYGGAVFACNAVVNVTLADLGRGHAAERGGGVAFECLSDAPAPPGTGPTRWILGVESVGAGSASAAYGPVWASPVHSLQVVDPPQAVISGVPVGKGMLVGRDVFGSVVKDPSLTLSLSLVDQVGVFVLTGVEVGLPFLTGAGGAPLDDAVLAVEWTELSDVFPPDGEAVELQSALSPGAPTVFTPVTRFSMRLTLCPPGYGRVSEASAGAVQCAACRDGTYSDVTSAEGCVIPTECPDNTVRPNNSSDGGGLANQDVPCVCLPGYFVRDGTPNQACTPCPEGGVCFGGTSPPEADAGFYPTGPFEFSRCLRPKACVGGTQLCAPGYGSFMCLECEASTFSNDALECEPCPSEGDAFVFGTLFLVLVLSFGLALPVTLGLAKSARKAGGVAPTIEGLRTRVLPSSPSMVAVSFQIVGLLAISNVGFDSSSRNALNVLNVANFDLNLWVNECTFETFEAKYLARLVFLFSILGLAIMWALGLKVLSRTRCAPRVIKQLADVSFRSMGEGVVFSVAPLLYVPISRTALMVFNATRLPNGRWVLRQDPSVGAFETGWIPLAAAGGLAVVFFVLGLPSYILRILRANRQRLLEPSVFGSYGSLYRIYRIPFYWGGVAELGKRLILVVAATFLVDLPLVQVGVMLVVVLWSAFATKSMSIHYFPLYDDIAARLSLSTAAFLGMGVSFYAERRRSDGPPPVLFASVVVALVVLVCVSLHSIVSEVIQIIQSHRGRYTGSKARALRLSRMIELEREDMDTELAQSLELAMISLQTQGGGRTNCVHAVEMNSFSSTADHEDADADADADFKDADYEDADYEDADYEDADYEDADDKDADDKAVFSSSSSSSIASTPFALASQRHE